MKTSIATVSLGCSLSEKLEAIAAAGFAGVELFETDILSHDGAPEEVGRMVRDLGLEIVAFQPFRDFEGMPEPRRARGFERARRKFELMNELGADTLLVCSNVSPHAVGGIDRAAADLHELGGVAAEYDINIGYEALAWGRFVSDYRDAWEIVRRCGHDRVGIILDSWHMLARGLPTDAMRSIPADKISFVQIADAPHLDMDLLQWSRHFRNFPGQGDLPIGDFMAALATTGYDGWLSLEIFNDRFRMASARRIAEDGERSLLWLMDRSKGKVVASRVVPEGVEWMEFSVSESDAGELSSLFRQLGFARTGTHKTKDVERWSQGNINLVINTETEGFAHSHQITHGASVAAIGLSVDDAVRAMDRAESLNITTFRQQVGPGELDIPAVRGVGGSLIYFIDSKSDLDRVWDIEFDATGEESADAGLTSIDHIAQSMMQEETLSWRLFYLSLFDFETTPQVDIADPSGIVESQVLQDQARTLRICLNTSEAQRTMTRRFMSEYFGAGVQHIAFSTGDIFASVDAMRKNGLPLLPIPENYYDDLDAKFDLDAALLGKLRELNILYDEDENGRYFQAYTKAFDNRFFFEIISRDGYQGFGASNAPIRLAAQARVARHPKIPKR